MISYLLLYIYIIWGSHLCQLYASLTRTELENFLSFRCGSSDKPSYWYHTGSLFDLSSGRKIANVEGIELIEKLSKDKLTFTKDESSYSDKNYKPVFDDSESTLKNKTRWRMNTYSKGQDVTKNNGRRFLARMRILRTYILRDPRTGGIMTFHLFGKIPFLKDIQKQCVFNTETIVSYEMDEFERLSIYSSVKALGQNSSEKIIIKAFPLDSELLGSDANPFLKTGLMDNSLNIGLEKDEQSQSPTDDLSRGTYRRNLNLRKPYSRNSITSDDVATLTLHSSEFIKIDSKINEHQDYMDSEFDKKFTEGRAKNPKELIFNELKKRDWWRKRIQIGSPWSNNSEQVSYNPITEIYQIFRDKEHKNHKMSNSHTSSNLLSVFKNIMKTCFPILILNPKSYYYSHYSRYGTFPFFTSNDQTRMCKLDLTGLHFNSLTNEAVGIIPNETRSIFKSIISNQKQNFNPTHKDKLSNSNIYKSNQSDRINSITILIKVFYKFLFPGPDNDLGI